LGHFQKRLTAFFLNIAVWTESYLFFMPKAPQDFLLFWRNK